MYQVIADGCQTSLTLLQTVRLEVGPWDVTFDDSSNTLWMLSPVEGATLSAFTWSSDRGSGESGEALQVLFVCLWFFFLSVY